MSPYRMAVDFIGDEGVKGASLVRDFIANAHVQPVRWQGKRLVHLIDSINRVFHGIIALPIGASQWSVLGNLHRETCVIVFPGLDRR